MNYIFFAKHIFVFHVSSLNDVTSFFHQICPDQTSTDGRIISWGRVDIIFIGHFFSSHILFFLCFFLPHSFFSGTHFVLSLSPPSPSFLSHTIFFLHSQLSLYHFFLPSFPFLSLSLSLIPLFLHYSLLPLTHIFFSFFITLSPSFFFPYSSIPLFLFLLSLLCSNLNSYCPIKRFLFIASI